MQYEAQVTFAPSSIRVYAPPLPVKLIQEHVPDKNVEQAYRAYMKLEWSVYPKILEAVVANGTFVC
jgi:hypothetical protein